MALENRLGLTNSAELAREEERISKKKAASLFEKKVLDNLPKLYPLSRTFLKMGCLYFGLALLILSLILYLP